MYGTVHNLAVNGHMMEYQITCYYADGEPKLSQYDAQHSDQCRCKQDSEPSHRDGVKV